MEEKEIRFYKALDNYINQKSNDWKEYSRQGIIGRAKRIKDIFADLKLEAITTEELQDYVDDWQKQFSNAYFDIEANVDNQIEELKKEMK